MKYTLMKRHYLILALLLASTTSSIAQGVAETTTDSVATQILFRKGDARYDGKFMNNDADLDNFLSRIDGLHADPTVQIVRLKVSAGASPEGVSVQNEQLSRDRAHSMRAEIEKRLPYLSGVLEENAIGVDWDGLAALIEKDANVPAAAQALNIIRNTPVWVHDAKGRIVDSRKRQLQMLLNGQTWFYIDKNLFPALRGSSVNIICEIRRQEAPKPQPQPEPVVEQPVAEPTPVQPTLPEPAVEQPAEQPAPTVMDENPLYLAVRTNMLYDALLLPNIGVDVYLGKNWSVDAIWHYGWWKNDTKHDYWRTYGGDIALRYWFGTAAHRKPLTGHHVGLYGQMVTYDFEFGGRGYLGPKWSYGGGLEYGYAMPISRHFNIDFSLGLGYLRGKYYEYIPIDQCYVWQKTKQRNWFGPTKLEISLVWLLGRGNVNEKSQKNETDM